MDTQLGPDKRFFFLLVFLWFGLNKIRQFTYVQTLRIGFEKMIYLQTSLIDLIANMTQI